MPQVKILKLYENTAHWIPGQIVDISNPWSLIKEGKVVLVDTTGEEMERPEVLTQIRTLVSSRELIDFIGKMISKHPEKDRIIQTLSESGIIIPLKEEIQKKEIETSVKPTPIEVVERPRPVVTEAEVQAKVAELRKKVEEKKKGAK